jgi:hypothetical protein
LLGFPQLGIEAVRHTHVQRTGGGFGGAKHAVRLLQIHRDRFFDQHVFTTLQRLNRDFAMQMRRQADAHRVDIAFDQILVARVGPHARREIVEPGAL